MVSSYDNAMLTQLTMYLESYNAINLFTTLFLTVFGILGNLFACVVLLFSKQKLPRIIGVNYLVMLTLINTWFLLVQFYIGTYNRLIYFFDIDYQKSLQFLDSSLVCCKLLPYLRYVTRLMNTMFTLCFSLERLLAVYCPLKMRARETYCSMFFKFSTIVSVIIPSYLIFLTDLVPNSEMASSIYQSYGLKKSFNFNSLTPMFGNYTCSISKNNLSLMLKFHFVMFLIILLSYVVISVSIFAIVLQLKKNNTFIFAYRSKNSNSMEQPNRKNMDSFNQLLGNRTPENVITENGSR